MDVNCDCADTEERQHKVRVAHSNVIAGWLLFCVKYLAFNARLQLTNDVNH